MEVQQLIIAALERIEEKLDKKADKEDVARLEERVRKNEGDVIRAYAAAGVLSFIAGFVGWKQ